MPMSDTVQIGMVYRDSINMKMSMPPFAQRLRVNDTEALMMYLVHESLAFGVDPMLLKQADPMTLGTLDNLPLNII